MSYNIVLTEHFKKEAKGLIKKYRSLKAELETLGDRLTEAPKSGSPLGNGIYKIRISIASKSKGKSGGARIIACVKVVQEKFYRVSIYDKSQLKNLSKEQILKLLYQAGLT